MPFMVASVIVDSQLGNSQWTPSDQVSKFSTNWTNLPKSIPSINLVVAFKANDHFAQVSHTHQRTNMSNRVKSENVNVIKTNITLLKKFPKRNFKNC
jgi:hypothetical protein